MPTHRTTLLLLCLTAVVQADDPSTSAAPWWHRYPVYIGDVGAGSCNEATAVDLHAAMVSGNFGADPAWGPYGQAVSFQSVLALKRHYLYKSKK